MVFTETCPDYTDPNYRGSSNVFTVLLGERVYSSIMLFVVVQSARGFCYACPIQTYSGRGTLKKGCHPSEHAIAHTEGEQPAPFPDETLVKTPIPILRSSTDIKPLSRAARIRFGRGQAIQYNVKAKDIGRVKEDYIPLLVRYWQMEIGTASNAQGLPLRSGPMLYRA